jgi:hypothetical protein
MHAVAPLATFSLLMCFCAISGTGLVALKSNTVDVSFVRRLAVHITGFVELSCPFLGFLQCSFLT